MTVEATTEAHLKHRKREAERRRETTRTGQDIGPLPEVVNRERRTEGEGSFRRFCEIYFPNRFELAWSPHHLRIIARMEEAVCVGGLFALAMPRKFGKTTLSEVAVIWATITGRHEYAMLIAVSADVGSERLEAIKTELRANETLYDDFPEVCHPIRELEDRSNRAKGQHLGGRHTLMRWRKDMVVLPYVEGSKASGAVIRCGGLEGGGIRGAKFVRPHDGKTARPSLVILDDPQSDDSAGSPFQCQSRHRLIHGAVLGMAGPKKKITAICPCTVIRKGDLADMLLDREKSPFWTGQKLPLLLSFPKRMDLWHEYGEMLKTEMGNGGSGALATAWYAERRAEMDDGAAPAWPEKYQPDEISALQNAMNLLFLSPEAFWSEGQQEPLREEQSAEQLEPDAVAARVNGLERGILPQWAGRVTAFVDVQQKCLFYLVAGWSDDFTGAILDYGTFPDQHRRYFSLSDARNTLARQFPKTGLEGSIYAGLTETADLLLNREWWREDGTAFRVERLLVDAGWGMASDTVHNWCRSTPHAAVVMPSVGRYVGATSKPWSEYRKEPGARLGFHWMIPAPTGKRVVRYVLLDVNFWKSFVSARLRTPIGDRGALTLWGQKDKEGRLLTDHRLFAEHACSEYYVRASVKAAAREVDEWKAYPSKPDNHWWDGIVGAAAAASLQGCALAEAQASRPKAAPKRVSFAAMQKERKGIR